MVKWTTFRKCE